MNSESPPPTSVSELPILETKPDEQVRFKSQAGRLLLLLPPEPEGNALSLSWSELWEQLKHRLNAGERFWQPRTTVHLLARNRLLDARQLQAIDEVLAEADLSLKRIYTSRRQTAVAATTAGYSVDQHAPVTHLNQNVPEAGRALEEPLYVQSTIRAGVEIRHNGTVIVLGDVNPGGSIVAEGDILIWGRLRGLAHAGYGGNSDCRIMALRMDPTQLRIADQVARPPETPPDQYLPEVAYVGSNGIRIALAADFARLMSKA
jgi:septum site-determining protein MinC